MGKWNQYRRQQKNVVFLPILLLCCCAYYLSYLSRTAVLYVNIDSFELQAKRMDPIEKQGDKGLASLDRLPGDGSHCDSWWKLFGGGEGRGWEGDCIMQLISTRMDARTMCPRPICPGTKVLGCSVSRTKGPLALLTLPDTCSASKMPDLRHLSHNRQIPS